MAELSRVLDTSPDETGLRASHGMLSLAVGDHAAAEADVAVLEAEGAVTGDVADHQAYRVVCRQP